MMLVQIILIVLHICGQENLITIVWKVGNFYYQTEWEPCSRLRKDEAT